MKRWIALGMLVLAGCASAHIDEWDVEHSTVTACGNKYADDEFLKQTAQEKCANGNLTHLRDFQRQAGITNSPMGGMWICAQYRCNERSASSK